MGASPLPRTGQISTIWRGLCAGLRFLAQRWGARLARLALAGLLHRLGRREHPLQPALLIKGAHDEFGFRTGDGGQRSANKRYGIIGGRLVAFAAVEPLRGAGHLLVSGAQAGEPGVVLLKQVGESGSRVVRRVANLEQRARLAFFRWIELGVTWPQDACTPVLAP